MIYSNQGKFSFYSFLAEFDSTDGKQRQYTNDKLLYEDMVKNVESAAKREAVLIAAPRAFSKSIEENMAIIEAIEKTDPGELQRKVIQFTEDAIALVDESCRVNTAAAKSAPGEFLNRILEG